MLNTISRRTFLHLCLMAVDCVMCDFLAAEVSLTAHYDDYLKLANQAGLGVFERGAPRGSGYQTIRYSYNDI